MLIFYAINFYVWLQIYLLYKLLYLFIIKTSLILIHFVMFVYKSL